jgi:hypothetical protein
MDYQKLWFSLKEELIEIKNKGDMPISDLIEKMDRMEVLEFKFCQLPKSSLLCEEDTKKWLNLVDNTHRCNLCGGELYYTGDNMIGLPAQRKYKCRACHSLIVK